MDRFDKFLDLVSGKLKNFKDNHPKGFLVLIFVVFVSGMLIGFKMAANLYSIDIAILEDKVTSIKSLECRSQRSKFSDDNF